MLFKITLIIASLFCCIQSLSVLEGNTTKSTPQKSSCYCPGSNQVSIDCWCYCAPNYKKNSLGNCVYQGCNYLSDCSFTHDLYRHCSGSICVCDSGYSQDRNNGRKCVRDSWAGSCSSDSDCIKTNDLMRHCSGGTCVCDYGYSEDWSNGGKCTYDTYSVSVWAWVWVFFVIPAIAVAIYLCLRRRRMRAVPQVIHVQSQPQFQTTTFHPPPPAYTNYEPQQQQQPVTVYRY